MESGEQMESNDWPKDMETDTLFFIFSYNLFSACSLAIPLPSLHSHCLIYSSALLRIGMIKLILHGSSWGLQRLIYLPNVTRLLNEEPVCNAMMLDARTQASNLDLLCFRYQAEG